MLALAASGRRVSLDDLGTWRKDGLLPPLASHGVRTAGRCYYWREPDIQAHAEAVHDVVRRHGRNDFAVINLWLRGFEVPLPRLRRAWLHRNKRVESARIRQAPDNNRSIQISGNGLSVLLLSATYTAAISIENSTESMKAALAVLERATRTFGRPSHDRVETEAHWRIAMAMLQILGSGDVISATSDEELREAQRYLRRALEFLLEFRERESADDIVDFLGPPICLFMVILLRSGQRGLLEAIMNCIAVARRNPEIAATDRPLQSRPPVGPEAAHWLQKHA